MLMKKKILTLLLISLNNDFQMWYDCILAFEIFEPDESFIKLTVLE